MNVKEELTADNERQIKEIQETVYKEDLKYFAHLLFLDWTTRIPIDNHNNLNGSGKLSYLLFSKFSNMNVNDAYHTFLYFDKSNNEYITEEEFTSSICELYNFKNIFDNIKNNKNLSKFKSPSSPVKNVHAEVILNWLDEVLEGAKFCKLNKNLKKLMLKMFHYNDAVSQGIFHGFILQPNHDLKKAILVIEGNYIYKYTVNTSPGYTLLSLNHLRGYYAFKCRMILHNNKKVYPLALTLQYGNTLSNSNNIFIFDDRSEREIFIKIIKHKLNNRKLKYEYQVEEQVMPNLYTAKRKYEVDPVTKENKFNLFVGVISKNSIKNTQHVIQILCKLNILAFVFSKFENKILNFVETFEDREFVYLVVEYSESRLKKLYENQRKISSLRNENILNRAKDLQFYSVHKIITENEFKILNTSASNQEELKDNKFPNSNNSSCVNSVGIFLSSSAHKSSIEVFLKDVWNLGIFIFYLETGVIPFSGASKIEIVKNNINSTSLKTCFDFQLNNDYYRIISMCLNRNN